MQYAESMGSYSADLHITFRVHLPGSLCTLSFTNKCRSYGPDGFCCSTRRRFLPSLPSLSLTLLLFCLAFRNLFFFLSSYLLFNCFSSKSLSPSLLYISKTFFVSVTISQKPHFFFNSLPSHSVPASQPSLSLLRP